MGRLFVLVVFLGCAETPTRRDMLEASISYQRDARAFAIPAVVFSAVGLTLGAADIAADDSPALRGISIACLASGMLSTVVAAAYQILSDDEWQRYRRLLTLGRPR